MIAPVKKSSNTRSVPRWHAEFLEKIVPAVQRHGHAAFRHMLPEAKQEALAEAVAAATQAYVSLCKRGRRHLAFPSTMARFAICHVRNGKHVGGHQSHSDVLSEVARRRHGFTVVQLSLHDLNEPVWQEALTEAKHVTPAELAGTRLDFASWLAALPRRDQRIVEALACGGTTSEVARRFKLSSGRISQKRREYEASWLRRQDQDPAHQPA